MLKKNSKDFSLRSIRQGKKGFSLIELIVVIAILGLLVMLATPKFLGYVEKAQLARIQYDVKVMEDRMAEDSINGIKDFVDWDDNAKDLGLLVLADLLYETEGKAKNVAKPRTKYGDVASNGDMLSEVEEASDYKIMPEVMSKRIKTNLPGTFYTNVDGKVYYEHDKPLKNVKEEVVIRCEAPEPLDYDFEHISGTIVKYNGTSQHLVIPSAFKVDDKCWPVRIIGRGAFMQGGYRTIVIPEGVQIIEDDAFKENKLESVTIPHGVGSIGAGAFAGNNLGGSGGGGSGGVIIRNTPSNISIGNGAFSDNGPSGDTEATPQFRPATDKDLQVSFDKGAGAITDYKGNDTVVVIPPTIMIDGVEYPVKSVEKGAYQGRGLITVILPEGLERIEAYAFSGNQLIGITIPNSVNHIGNYAFAFNEVEKVGNISGPKTKATIKTIIIDGGEQFEKLNKYGDIAENEVKVDEIGIVKLQSHIFVTSISNFIIDIQGNNNLGSRDNGYTDDEIQALIDNNYIPIATSHELSSIRSNTQAKFGLGTKWEKDYIGGLGKKYIQVANIDLSSIENFEPIGNTSSHFTGIYDGGKFKISNLTISRPTESYLGLFGYVNKANIQNINMINVDMIGSSHMGGLIGKSESSSITKVSATGKIEGIGSIGINGCYIGGVIGWNEKSSIIESYAITNVSGSSNISGFVGRNVDSSIINSYSGGNHHAITNVAGLVGHNYFGGKVINSYAVGKISHGPHATYTGGLTGRNDGSVVNSYYDTESTEKNSSAGGIGRLTVEMKDKKQYKDWDFEDVWQIISGEYPTLQWQNN